MHVREGAGVVTTRAHVRTVVTEWGVAELFGKSLRERAKALIAIAHPDFRADLQSRGEPPPPGLGTTRLRAEWPVPLATNGAGWHGTAAAHAHTERRRVTRGDLPDARGPHWVMTQERIAP